MTEEQRVAWHPLAEEIFCAKLAIVKADLRFFGDFDREFVNNLVKQYESRTLAKQFGAAEQDLWQPTVRQLNYLRYLVSRRL